MQVNKIYSEGVILNELVKATVEKYSKFYFELDERTSFIEKNLKIEEEKNLWKQSTQVNFTKQGN